MNLKKVLNDESVNITEEINCLEYALQYWEKNPKYKLWYNSDHVINIPENTTAAFGGINKYRPIEDFGFVYVVNAFDLSDRGIKLLKRYFQTFNQIDK